MSPVRIAVACLTAMSLSAAALFSISSYASGSFDAALMRSGYIHEPLRHTDGISLEDEALAKSVLDSVELRGSWRVWGERASLVPGEAVMMRVNFDTDSDRAIGSAGDPDYALYGHAVASLDLGGADLSAYNRLCLLIEPHCPGIRVVNINLAFNNRNAYGEGFNPPTGAHLIQLRPDTLNRCYLEIADLRRDCIDNISLSVSINGADLPVAAEALYTIRGISAQRVGEVEKISGWEPAASHIIYSQSGYVADGPKTAICHESLAGRRYKVVRTADNTEVLKGKISKQKSTTGTYGVIDFSKLTTPGSYRIVTEGTSTAPFVIGDDSMWDSSCWRVLNFIFCQLPVVGILESPQERGVLDREISDDGGVGVYGGECHRRTLARHIVAARIFVHRYMAVDLGPHRAFVEVIAGDRQLRLGGLDSRAALVAGIECLLQFHLRHGILLIRLAHSHIVCLGIFVVADGGGEGGLGLL